MKTFLSFLVGLLTGVFLGSYVKELTHMGYEALKAWLAS